MAARERFQLISAVHILFIEDGRVLMLRRANTGYEDGSYSVPAGHLNGGETVAQAAAREAREECGVEICAADVDPVLVMHRRTDDERIDFFLRARSWSGAIRNAEPEKCDELSWHPIDALPPNVIPYVRHAIEQYRAGVWFTQFGWSH